MSYKQPEPAQGIRTIAVWVPQNADFSLLGGWAPEHLWKVPTPDGDLCVLVKYLPCSDAVGGCCARAHVAAELAKAFTP